MKIIVVDNVSLARDFLNFPVSLYANDSQYIRPLDKDIEEVFDQEKNKFFRHGECERWLVQNGNGKYIARVAVFVYKKYAQEQPTGGIGFFECIDDQEAANFIFGQA